MALKQPTNQFLRDEFQFALKASQEIRNCSKLGTYFLIECGDVFKTVMEGKDQALLKEIFFVNPPLIILKSLEPRYPKTNPAELEFHYSSLPSQILQEHSTQRILRKLLEVQQIKIYRNRHK
jgi:hypothetical protein